MVLIALFRSIDGSRMIGAGLGLSQPNHGGLPSHWNVCGWSDGELADGCDACDGL